MGSGKNTAGEIIRVLEYFRNNPEAERTFQGSMEGTALKVIEGKAGLGTSGDLRSYKIKMYADKLKDIVCLLIGCTRADLEDHEFKNKPLGEEWGGELTVRILLQKLGTECGRDIIHPMIWINSLFSDYKLCDKWIVTDVRMVNEAEEIKKRGGTLIRINRGTPSGEEHSSETQLDGYQGFDHVIDNNGSIEELIEKLKAIL